MQGHRKPDASSDAIGYATLVLPPAAALAAICADVCERGLNIEPLARSLAPVLVATGYVYASRTFIQLSGDEI
jgi:hypothetical protein